MTVYVDEVFALNLLLDWLLLRISVTLTGQRIAWYRLALAALLGAIYAVLTLLPGLSWLTLLPCRLVSFAAMACAAFGCSRRAVKAGLWFFGVCLGFCGLAYAASVLSGRGVFLQGGAVWYAVSFRFLVLLAGLSYLVVWLLLPKLGRRGAAGSVALTLLLEDRRVPLTALVDTGNSLRDPVTGGAVLVADAEVLRRLLPQTPLTAAQLADPVGAMALLRLLCPSLKPRLLPYRAVGTEHALLLAIPCACLEKRDGKPRPVLVAFSPTPVSDGGLYDALIGGT